ncbi:MAG: hypothetical protein WCC92_07490 [Candidatus Korobacteraceae bacterium]
MIVVIDTNVWISALQFAKHRGTPTRALEKAISEDVIATCGISESWIKVSGWCRDVGHSSGPTLSAKDAEKGGARGSSFPMACFGNAFHKITITAKAMLTAQPAPIPDARCSSKNAFHFHP